MGGRGLGKVDYGRRRRIIAGVMVEDTTPLEEIWFLSLDTETTGLSWKSEQLVEVAAVWFRVDGEVGETFSELINPGRPIPRQATAVHGITDAMVADRPRVHQVMPRFLEFAGQREGVMLIHNAGFDLGFLRWAILRSALEQPRIPVIDTLGLCRKVLRDMNSHRLDLLAARFCGKERADHRALGDAMVVREVFTRMVKDHAGHRSWADLMTVAKLRPFAEGVFASTP